MKMAMSAPNELDADEADVADDAQLLVERALAEEVASGRISTIAKSSSDVEHLVAHRLAEGVERERPDARHDGSPPAATSPSRARRRRRRRRHRPRARTDLRATRAAASTLTILPPPASASRSVASTSASGGDALRPSPRRPSRATTSVCNRRGDSSASSGPTSRMRPPTTMATRSQMSSTSERMCVENSTVLPSRLSSTMRSRISLRPIGIEPRHRLVEHHELGIVHQRLRDAEALQHALRIFAQRAGRRRARARRARAARARRLRRSARAEAEQAPHEVEQLRARQVVVEVRVLRQEAEPLLRGARRAPAGRRCAPAPRVGKMRPISIFSVVVLPAPLGPRKPKISLGSTVNDDVVDGAHLLAEEAERERLLQVLRFDDGALIASARVPVDGAQQALFEVDLGRPVEELLRLADGGHAQLDVGMVPHARARSRDARRRRAGRSRARGCRWSPSSAGCRC